MISLGSEFGLNDNVALSLAFIYSPENDVDGPISTPLTGPIPGSSVENQLSAYAVAASLHIRY